MTNRGRTGRNARASITVMLRATNLPGRRSVRINRALHKNAHIGLSRRGRAIRLVPADAKRAKWRFKVFLGFPEKQPPPDFGGPFVSGNRPNQRITLWWGTLNEDGTFTEFAPVWLRLAHIDEDLITEALILKRPLVGQFPLTRPEGPLRLAIRDSDVTWTVGEPTR
jgi:Family of unknown function (DUF5990)